MTNVPDERGLELRELFYETSQELLQALNDQALALEKNPGDEEIVRGIRRTVHTLKGDSAACGLREISELAHQFEDALSLEGAASKHAVAEIAFATADIFVEMIAAYRSGGKMPSAKELSRKIEALTAAPAQQEIAEVIEQEAVEQEVISEDTAEEEAAETSESAPARAVRRTARGSKKRAAGKTVKTKVAKGKTVKSKGTKAKSAKARIAKTLKTAKTTRTTTRKPPAVKSAASKPVPAKPAPTVSAAAKPAPAKGAAKASATSTDLWTEYERMAMSKAQASGQDVLHVFVKLDPHCAMPIAGRQLVQNAVSTMGPVIAVRPDPKSPAATKYIEFVMASMQTPAQIAAKCKIPTIVEEVTLEVMLAAADAPKPAPAPASPTPESNGPVLPELEAHVAAPHPTAAPAADPAAAHATQENILRVEAGRIDSVLNLVGELIIGKSMLQQALNEFGKRYPKELLRGKFADAMAFQARVLNDLQRSVMKIRMVPVEQLFRRFPRMVRDVARQCGREVELAVSGQETDLDKGILDAIAEPITHLVRNAISHGIETPEERRKAGKPAQGTVKLNAYHHGNQVIVEVSDDGRGIDAQKIRTKAIELGLTTPEEAARLSEPEILDFIFKPGFSTAEQVTEVSGRGVGMDVVQSVLHRLKAAVSVETSPGKGTTFRLKLPLTLAIIKALLFWVEQRLYAIPLNAVVEISRTFEAEVHQVDNYEVLQLRNQVLPLLRLGRPLSGTDDARKAKLFVLVIMVGERKYGLIVDALEGEEELVIKALDDQTFSTDLVSGASILGDGRVVLILNLPAVVEHVARWRPDETGQSSAGLLLTATDRMRLAMGSLSTGSGVGGQA